MPPVGHGAAHGVVVAQAAGGHVDLAGHQQRAHHRRAYAHSPHLEGLPLLNVDAYGAAVAAVVVEAFGAVVAEAVVVAYYQVAHVELPEQHVFDELPGRQRGHARVEM